MASDGLEASYVQMALLAQALQGECIKLTQGITEKATHRQR